MGFTLSSATAIPQANIVASILKPVFHGVPDGSAVARYLVESMIYIAKYNLQIKIYITKQAAEFLSNLLTALNISFKTIPVSKMVYPCILISVEDGYFVVTTYNNDGSVLSVTRVPIPKLIEELQAIIAKRRRLAKKSATKEEEEVYEVMIAREVLELSKVFEEERKEGVSEVDKK